MTRQTSRVRNVRNGLRDTAGAGHAIRAVRNDFTARVLSIVRRIPRGRVATYGDVAELAGRPRASRAVGNIMRTCGRIDIPCHRVIAAGGRLGGYGGDEPRKRSLLIAEGILVSRSRVRDFEQIRWRTRPGSNRADAARRLPRS